MSDEQETVETEDLPEVATANIDSDDCVTARWDVAVIPGDKVSAHFFVTPKNEKDAVLSVTISFVGKVDGVVVHSYAGATVQETVKPVAGQGSTGDAGVDIGVFGESRECELFAVLAGTVRTAEEELANFFFSRPFTLEA